MLIHSFRHIMSSLLGWRCAVFYKIAMNTSELTSWRGCVSQTMQGTWQQDQGECGETLQNKRHMHMHMHGQTISFVFHGIVICCECALAYWRMHGNVRMGHTKSYWRIVENNAPSSALTKIMCNDELMIIMQLFCIFIVSDALLPGDCSHAPTH